MKLLAAFQQQIRQFKSLKKVWLTSFNINIEFIEKYLLPAVLQEEVPTTRLDYEALQAKLKESGIDFRVFCDKRFIDMDGVKRTAIPIHGLLPERDLGFAQDSIFHAKVIYLEGDKEDISIVGSGSANLTYGGWSRNQEVFAFYPADSKRLLDDIKTFFAPLAGSVGLDRKHTKFKGKLASNHASNMRFCHSMQKTPFLTQLFDDGDSNLLAVWSPYFPKDLAAFIDTLKQRINRPNLSVHIVPDKIDNQYMRTQWNESLERKLQAGELAFYQSPQPLDERSHLCHAKVWKTPSRLAIGSWNFTQAGANLALLQKSKVKTKAVANVEAGFIIDDDKPIESVLGDVLSVSDTSFADDKQLAEEALVVPNILPFSLQVTFRWSDLTYVITGRWQGEEGADNGYILHLPGCNTAISLLWRDGEIDMQLGPDRIDHVDALLADHVFAILHNGQIVDRGLIIEQDLGCRRAQHYNDLRDLLDGTMAGANDGSDAPHSVEEDDSGTIFVNGRPLHPDNQSGMAQTQDQSISFFRLFSATEQLANRLRGIKKLDGLEHWVFLRPGCLEELVAKTTERLNTTTASTVFNWFLVQEVNGLVELAKQRKGQIKPGKPQIPDTRWQGLSLTMPPLPENADSRYCQRIANDYYGTADREEVQ